jgi:hypothetical protein
MADRQTSRITVGQRWATVGAKSKRSTECSVCNGQSKVAVGGTTRQQKGDKGTAKSAPVGASTASMPVEYMWSTHEQEEARNAAVFTKRCVVCVGVLKVQGCMHFGISQHTVSHEQGALSPHSCTHAGSGCVQKVRFWMIGSSKTELPGCMAVWGQ